MASAPNPAAPVLDPVRSEIQKRHTLANAVGSETENKVHR